MKQFLILAFLLVNFIVHSQTKSNDIQTINGKKYYLHIIEKGQSLYSLSKLYDVKLDDIYAENPDLKNGTKAGQEIKIPYAKPEITTSSDVFNDSKNSETKLNKVIPMELDTTKFICHKVEKGETIYAITKKYKITSAYFDKLNPIAKQGLKEGQMVAIGEKKSLIVQKPTIDIVTNSVSPKSDTTFTTRVNFEKKTEYTLELVLPFKLDNIDLIDPNTLAKTNGNFPQISALALDFYLGFKAAVDSLQSKEFKLTTKLIDLDDNDSINLAKLLLDLETNKPDFIFGPLYANEFKILSQKANELNIPIVSPITQQNKFLYNNIFASKTNPSQYTTMEAMADYILDSLKPKKAKLMLYIASEKDSKESSYVKAFKLYYSEKARLRGLPVKDSIFTVRSMADVKKNYLDGVENIILTVSNNQVMLTDFITQLALFANKKTVTLCGWQSTTQIDNIDQEYLNQLKYTFPSANNLTNTKAYTRLTDKYKEQQNTYPNEFYFIGFDIAYYYLTNLKLYGPNFIFRLNELPMQTNYMRFKFVRPDNITGFDNNGVYIMKYSDYQLKDTGWN